MLSLAQQDIVQPIQPMLFYAFAAIICISAIGVLLSRQIVRMALYLLGTLAGVAGLYFFLHAELLGAIQLIVYAGGTLVLIIFGIMLTTKNPWARLQISTFERNLGIEIGLAAFAVMAWIAFQWTGSRMDEQALAHVTEYPVATIGRVLLSKYLIPFEVVGVLLLVVMIAAAYMAKGRRAEEIGR